jgi:D-sedoheptulose 7-phosphate isomerase
MELEMKDSTISDYQKKLITVIDSIDHDSVLNLCRVLKKAWDNGDQVFICGNGGSAANAVHFSNDLFYGVAKNQGKGIKVHALPANQSIITCIANDESYKEIFSKQIEVFAKPEDILIVLTGSGNSDNIIEVIIKAKEIGMKTFGLFGYSGGKAINIVDSAIHFKIDDMEIAEDCQQIISHMVKMWLIENKHMK